MQTRTIARTDRIIIAGATLAWFIASASSIGAWALHADGPIRHIANLFYLLSLPGWIPIYALGFSGVRDQPLTILIANAVSWVLWGLLIRIGWQTYMRMLRAPVPHHDSPADPSRRAFFAHSTLGVGAVGMVASPTYATLIEPWSIQIRRYTVPVRALPPSLEGLRLVQFSDSHLGPRIPASFIRSAVRQVVDLKPDLLLLTGDYIHDNPRDIDPIAELCRPMIDASRMGAVGVLGNHDWWGDGPRMADALANQGVHMIDNDRVWLDPAACRISRLPIPSGLAIVGLGDLDEDTIDPRRAFDQIGSQTPRIVLAHQPDTAELSVLTAQHAPRIDLMCSGHTHGGQVKIPFIGTPLVPSRYGSKYAGGFVQGPAFPVVVSRGIGMSLLPVRFGVPPEIVEITLIRA